MWNPFKLMSNLIRELRANTEALLGNSEDLEANTNSVNGLTVLQLEANELQAEGNLLANETNRLLAEILKQLHHVPDPGPLSFFVTSEEENMLVFTMKLPAEPDGFTDIASGELKLKVGDADEQTIVTTKGQTEVTGLNGAQGATLTASFVYIDDSGNRSDTPSNFSATLADTIPPPSPGELGVMVTGEVADA